MAPIGGRCSSCFGQVRPLQNDDWPPRQLAFLGKRIIEARKPQIMDPICHDLPDIVPYREKVGGEGLAEFRLNLAGVLFHFPSDQGDMF